MSLQLQAQRQSIAQVRDWYEATAESVLAHRGSVFEALRLGQAVSARFIGLTAEEIDRKFAQQREELDHLSILNLMTSAEATVRDDYDDRVKKRFRDSLSQAYRKYHRDLPTSHKRHPPLDDGILEVLRSTRLVAIVGVSYASSITAAFVMPWLLSCPVKGRICAAGLTTGADREVSATLRTRIRYGSRAGRFC